MHVLVTGGAGYLGSVLVPLLLERGHRVTVLDSLMFGGQSLLGPWSHPGFEFTLGDIGDHATVSRLIDDVDGIVHLAAIVGDPACARDTPRAEATNLEASLTLLEEVERRVGLRLVFASTCSNYGKVPEGSVADESTELRPVSYYAESKVAVERGLLSRSESASTWTVLRFATLFGVSPRMRFDLTVNEFTMELLERGQLEIYGEQFWRPYVHVADAAHAIALTLSSEEAVVGGQVFNVGADDQNYTKGQIVSMIQDVTSTKGDVTFVHKEEDPRDYRVSFKRIRERLGFQPARSVEEGIAEIAALVRARIFTDYSDPRLRN